MAYVRFASVYKNFQAADDFDKFVSEPAPECGGGRRRRVVTADDTRFLKLALSLGRQGLGQCWPNPSVGCVLVKDGLIIGRGRTAPGGRPHAERVALAQAGEAARGATAYVSLEPCSHHGHTPPCAEGLIEAGVARVVAAIEDPDPRVSGRGFEMLRAAGVQVVSGLCAEEAEADLAGFLTRVRHGRPYVTLKLATSFDGRIATASGHSQWITGPAARAWVHGARARHDAVMVGAGTARADDPMLTVRDMGVAHQPVRVVVSRRLDIPLMSKLAKTARDVPVWLCHGPDADAALIEAWQGIGAVLLPCGLVRASAGCGRGAARTWKARIDPCILRRRRRACSLASGRGAGGRTGGGHCRISHRCRRAAGKLGPLGLDRLDAARRFELIETRDIGGDVLHRWVAPRDAGHL